MVFASGRQSFRVIGGETLHFAFSDIVDPSEVTALFDRIRDQCRGWRRMFWLWDMKAAQLVPRDARRLLLDQAIHLPLSATAVVTNEFLLRIPLTMLFEVISVEGAQRPPYRFFEDAALAASWIQVLQSGRSIESG